MNRADSGSEQALQPLIDRLERRFSERASAVINLTTAAYRRAPLEAVQRAEEDPEAAADQMAELIEFLDGRPPGELKLQVFTRESQGRLTGTVVQSNVEDAPFLLSTITEEVHRHGYEAGELFHPVIGVGRDNDWQVTAINPARQAQVRESLIHMELSHTLDEHACAQLAADLRGVLADAKAATRDFEHMKQRITEVQQATTAAAAHRYEQDEVDEAATFLGWLFDDHFVFLGARNYLITSEHVQVEPGSGLGILADEAVSGFAEATRLDSLDPGLAERIAGGDLLMVARTNRESTVHRRQRMVYVGIKRVGDDGRITGELRILGLFAQRAFAEPASTIPVLRRKLAQILEREDIVPNSYDERALRALWDGFPKQELFAAPTGQLQRIMVHLLETKKSKGIRVLVRTDVTGRSVSALVAVPRGQFTTELRQQVQRLLVDRFAAHGVDFHLSITESDQALMHFQLHAPGEEVEAASTTGLEAEVAALARSWSDALSDALTRIHGGSAGSQLVERWANAFPAGYQAQVAPDIAVQDIAELEMLSDGHPVRMRLQQLPEGENGAALRFKLYKKGQGIELSGFIPVLESLGMVVVEEIPHEAESPDGPLNIHDFGVRLDPDTKVDLDRDGQRLADAALAIYNGQAEADSLNRLVLHAGLPWGDVAVLRAYRRFRRQVGIGFTEEYQDAALVERSDIAAALIQLFRAKFAPEVSEREAAVQAARMAVEELLETVDRLDTDRILSGYLGVLDATLRTNRYVSAMAGGTGSPALAFKLNSTVVPELPKPVPYIEIFVYSPGVEGVHLRGGPVARGGVRWSDRQEDVRAEVLDLMKAQMVKNAIIVPSGSKGGFVLKARVEGTDVRAEVQRQYEAYVRALLDVTDNVVDGEVTTPPGIVRHDGDDPYLVVAADKGTATFSDVANRISDEYNFWLGDAFASGGSAGYDHKAMGITARGAWVSVQRHFRELSVDVQTEPITVVGIGDMSGDVFGNGLLRSRAVRLVAAFDHRDIFIDPDPDPERSYAERERLFALSRSSWQDYDRSLLSDGGGVWSRSAKEITLSEEAASVLRLKPGRVSPPDVAKAILRAPVDLLFNGGIGTFVKASDESHTDVGDRVNDPIRVNGDELGTRVVGEGGNLAMTQKARIQYARRGGRCNTDAIDNAAGVASSDVEVNLKILLADAIEKGALAAGDRDELLAEMTDAVADLVLRDVYLQTGTLSAESTSSGVLAYEQLMHHLESSDGQGAGGLDRAVELLPSTEEMTERSASGAGLTRPELAVLMGYAKIYLRDQLVNSALTEDAAMQPVLESMFPKRAAEQFADLMWGHRLRRELIATAVANDLVNRMGITYVNRTARELGTASEAVAVAYWCAREVANADKRWRRIEALDNRSDAGLQLQLKAHTDRMVDGFTRAYLREETTDISAVVKRDRPALEELETTVADLGSAAKRANNVRGINRYVDLGINEDLARQVVLADALVILPDVAVVARNTRRSITDVAEVFYLAGETLLMDRIDELLGAAAPSGQWERWQHRGLLDDLRELRRSAAGKVLTEHVGVAPDAAVEAYMEARTAGRQRIEQILGMVPDGEVEVAQVAVATRILRDVLS